MSKLYSGLFIDDRDEDNLLNDIMIREDRIPIDPYFVNGGQQALDYLTHLDQEDFPDLIFVDIKMPKMDGFQFIEAFNELFDRKELSVRIYFLTSIVNDADLERAKNMPGVDGLFYKPLRLEKFLQIAATYQ